MTGDLSTPLAAFIAGLVTSIHCAGMCGPLACALRVKPWHYHPARFVTYTLVGAILGGIGHSASLFFHGNYMHIMPWAMAAVLFALGFGLEKRLPTPRWIANLLLRNKLGASLGWVTPLLPCGPLYLMYGVAALSGAWQSGALLMGGFALGTIPLYWLLQTQFLRLQGRFSPGALRWTQQGLALLSAGLLVWRAVLPTGCCN